MAIAYNNDFLNLPRDLDARLRFTNPAETPFFTMVPVDNSPKEVKYECSVEQYVTGPTAPINEGADVAAGEITAPVPDVLVCRSQIVRAPTGVTQVANVIATGTEGKGAQLGKQVATHMVSLKYKMEAIWLSDQDSAAQSGVSTTAMATRGAFKWLQTAAQTNDPVPAAFRPAAACNFTGALDTFDEDALQAMIAAFWGQTQGNIPIMDAFVGIKLKQKLDNFTRLTEVAAGTQAVRRFEQNDPRVVVNTVNRLVYSGLTIEVHAQPRILTDLASSAAATAKTDLSGLFIDTTKWATGYNKAPVVEDLPDNGGGPKKNPNAIFMTICRNSLSGMTVNTAVEVTP